MSNNTDIQKLVIEGIQNRKGHGISVIDLSNIDTAATGTFIIAEGNSTTHTASIAESVEEHVRLNSGVKPYGIDGAEGSDWVIIDYGDIWVHIFMPETRTRYNLEELWSDAPIKQVADLD